MKKTSISRILVGMSGGVDSAAAALLLLRAGYEVSGLTLELTGHGVEHAADARSVCDRLGIAHETLDLRAEFRSRVMEPFAERYACGRTPNPCVICNRDLKFAGLAKAAKERGFDGIATGHYARVEHGGTEGSSRLRKGAYREKDQSYVLYGLSADILEMLTTPLGELSKEEVRALAQEAGLSVSRKKDSQDICFIPDGDYASFLERMIPGGAKPGVFVDESGRVLGAHRGLWHYTIGQRRGISHSFERRMYVGKIDAQSGDIVLCAEESLYRSAIDVSGVNWLYPAPQLPARWDVKIRYAHTPHPATVYPASGDGVRVEFERPQRAPAPGQSAVFYDGEYVVGGGVIG